MLLIFNLVLFLAALSAIIYGGWVDRGERDKPFLKLVVNIITVIYVVYFTLLGMIFYGRSVITFFTGLAS